MLPLPSLPLPRVIRVISSVEDCPTRDLKRWGVYSANPPSEDDIDVRAEGAPSVAASLVAQVMRDASDFPDGPQGGGLAPLPRSVAVPSSGRLLACCKSELFPEMGEFLALFHEPVGVDVESDQVWPLQNVVDN